MARLVGVFACSHAPLIVRAWESVDAARRNQVASTFAELHQRVRAARPQVLIVVSPDHWINFFIDNYPSVCIGIGEIHERPPEDWLQHLPYANFAGHPEFALHLVRTALDEGFEPSFSHRIRLDHGFAIPLWKMGLDPLPPVVPIVINSIEPPMPSLQRCLDWGRLVRRAVESAPADLRVAVLATGGLSHSIGEPDMGRIDEAFDREFIERLREGRRERLLAFLEQRLPAAGNGTAEIRNWLLAHAAADERGFELLGYHPCREWYVGCGFAAWNVRERCESEIP